MEKISYEITEPDGKEWDTTKISDVKKALLKGSIVMENKRMVSYSGITITRLQTITQMSLDHFQER